MGKHLEGVDISVVHIVRIRHTLVRIGPVLDIACTGETRSRRSRMSKEVTLAVVFLERERHVNRTVINSFCIKRRRACRQSNHIARTIQRTRSVCIRRPAKEIKSFHKTRFTDSNRSLAVHRVLVCDSVTCTSVVIIMNMPIRVRRNELKMSVRIFTVNMDTCPTITVDDRTSADYRHIHSAYHLTPSGDIRAWVVFVIFGTGKHRSFDSQSSVLLCNMPHLLASPSPVIIARTQLDVSAGIGPQEIATRLELHAEVLFARLRRIHNHLAVRTSRRRKT